jgi:hypothetical protein
MKGVLAMKPTPDLDAIIDILSDMVCSYTAQQNQAADKLLLERWIGHSPPSERHFQKHRDLNEMFQGSIEINFVA